MRYLTDFILKDLGKKMVFLGGPRQAGKTTLAKEILNTFPYTSGSKGQYLLWDDEDDRRYILKRAWTANTTLVVLDELHKFKRWKNWLKGTFDNQHEERTFLVTGSARLDLYKRGGDSMLGRYHYWRLHPFTLSELPAGVTKEDGMERLLTVGGFPEPFLQNDITQAQRWRRERLNLIIREDIRDLGTVQDLITLRLFADALRSRVGSEVVLSNIAQDLHIAPNTAKRWLAILEAMYLCFTVFPYTRSLPRAIQKPPKVFFYDNCDVIGDQGATFENLVATHLLKRIHFLEDSQGIRQELFYMRDKEKREVDFVITKEGVVDELIEVKLSDDKPSSSLKYFARLLKPRRAVQIVKNITRASFIDGIEIVPAIEELSRVT